MARRRFYGVLRTDVQLLEILRGIDSVSAQGRNGAWDRARDLLAALGALSTSSIAKLVWKNLRRRSQLTSIRGP